MEKDGKECKLIVKECRPDDECEYACGVEDRRSRARLFVEGIFAQYLDSEYYFIDTLCLYLFL